jgi:hypothetical protein
VLPNTIGVSIRIYRLESFSEAWDRVQTSCHVQKYSPLPAASQIRLQVSLSDTTWLGVKVEFRKMQFGESHLFLQCLDPFSDFQDDLESSGTHDIYHFSMTKNSEGYHIHTESIGYMML